MPMAAMISGTTMGEISMTMTTERSGKRARHRPMAASVPSAVASSVAERPTMMLFHSAGSQKLELKNSAYQRNERPGSG